MNKEKIEHYIRGILREIGEDPNRIGLKETPERVARMYEEIFRGYDIKQKPKITIFPNGEDGVEQKEMVIDRGYYFSQCEHHMVTFLGEYFFGYIPDKNVVGISKIARLIDWHSAKLQIQERLTKEVVEDFEKTVKPEGTILVMKGRHLCKEMRGVKKFNSPMITSEVTGVFERDSDTRNEFLRLMKL